MAVVATNKFLPDSFRSFALFLLCCSTTFAAVLPEERVDVLYHRYDGGGLEVDGPSVLVRKNIADKFSVNANYYVDNVSSASIDVVTQASPFEDKRTEKSVGAAYLYDRALLSASYIDSSESDYLSKTFNFDVSQDFFGDLSTLSFGYTRSNNTIKDNTDDDFKETSLHQEYRVGLTQILTRNLIVNLSQEVMVDDGYLSNPYRQFRFTDGATYSWSSEIFPEARTSYTTTLRARYHLPNYRAAVYGSYRYFWDGWDIKSHTVELGYNHTLPSGWLFDIHVRKYQQSAADFYSDLFAFETAQNHMTRDKQLSDFDSFTIGAGVSYELPFRSKWIDKSSVNIFWDRIKFDYNNYHDARVKGVTAGTEPLYSFEADVIRFFISIWY